MKYHQLFTSLVLAGLLSLPAIANSINNTSASRELVPRFDQKRAAFIKLCTGFKWGDYCELKQSEAISSRGDSCVTISDKLRTQNGGVSSILTHKAACRFYSTPDCFYRDKTAGYTELPQGTLQDLPPVSQYETFMKGNSGYCNLWGVTHVGGLDQWDNKILSYSCLGGEALLHQTPVCN